MDFHENIDITFQRGKKFKLKTAHRDTLCCFKRYFSVKTHSLSKINSHPHWLHVHNLNCYLVKGYLTLVR